MRLVAPSVALALAGHVLALERPVFSRNFKKQTLNKYTSIKSTSRYTSISSVPTYNISIPRDHFSSDTTTYENRYAVNDTYYQPGGPVIIYHFGEGAMDEAPLAETLAEYDGAISAPMQLAQRLNGLVIGWEHRYYGLSQPVENDESTGMPPGGLDDYRYLSLDQALEDVVYFANNFNTTTLDLNENLQDTSNLDPYHTPWLSLGASYPGTFSTWLRQKHPEIIYASWASSAPVQTQSDGSIYFNPIFRSLPKNCTDDIQAVFSYVDETLTSGSDDDVKRIKAGAYLSSSYYGSTDDDLSQAYEFTNGYTVDYLSWFTQYFQDFGPGQTTQVFCNYMEQFDVDEYLQTLELAGSSIAAQTNAALNNSASASPSNNGIVASQSQNGPAIGFAAFIYASLAYQSYIPLLFTDIPSSDQLTPNIDGASWTWQTFTEMGYFQYHNTSDPNNLGSKFQTQEEIVNSTIAYYFPYEYPSDFPSAPNFTTTLAYGGWNMQPSNIMFTNGEFDPWRAFSVATQEQDHGAPPQRTVTQDIPQCNQFASGTDVFGLVYAGAVHGEDMAISPYYVRGSEDTANPPLNQGLDLFESAYNAWLPCFNASRDSVRNGQAPAPNNNDDGDNSSSSNPNSNSNSQNAAPGRSVEGLSLALTLLAISYLTMI